MYSTSHKYFNKKKIIFPMLNKKREDRWNQIINNETCDGECPWHWDQC